jgi:hypothetical protein
VVLPNFAELDESGAEEIAVEYGDGMVITAPLIY